MPWRVISFFTALTFGGYHFIPHAHGMEKEDEPPYSFYQIAIHHPEQIKSSPQWQDALIHQILYEHYSLTPKQIKPCISLTRLYDLINKPLVGVGDETLLLNAKYFFLRYGKDLYAYTPSMPFDTQPFYLLMKNLEVILPTTASSPMTAVPNATQGVIETTTTPSAYSETYTPYEKPDLQQGSAVLFLDSYIGSLSCFLKGVYEESDGRIWSGNPLKAKYYYEMALNYLVEGSGPYCLPLASYELGRIYEYGIKDALQPDLEAAKNLYLAASNANDPRAAFALSRIFEAEKDFEAAFQKALIAAKLGHSQAQLKVGRYYHKGLGGVGKEDQETRKWYELSRQQGNLQADLRLARLLYLGKGGPQDLKGAFEIYEKLDKQGSYPNATYYLGYFYKDGHFVPKNQDKANSLFERAAKLGSEQAWNYLGVHLRTGTNEKRKAYETAIHLYRAKKNKPFSPSILNLVHTYVQLSDNLPKAEELLQDVSDLPRAQYYFGMIAEKQKNIQKARNHYEAALAKGYLDGARRLIDLETSPQIAWKWRYVLAMAGHQTDVEHLKNSFAEVFWLDHYLFTLKDQGSPDLKVTLEESLQNLKTAASGIPESNLFSSLSTPFDLCEEPGFLVSCVCFNSKRNEPQKAFHEEAGYKPFVFGARSYLIFGNSSIKQFNDFINKLKDIDEHLNKVKPYESTLKEEMRYKYPTIRQAFEDVVQVWEDFFESTVRQRNQRFFNRFNGILWPATQTGPKNNDDQNAYWGGRYTPEWTDNVKNVYWKDLHTLTVKTKDEIKLRDTWDNSLLNLKKVAQGTRFESAVYALNIPWDLFKTNGFLITLNRIKYPTHYKKALNCKPFQIGHQYYLVVGCEEIIKKSSYKSSRGFTYSDSFVDNYKEIVNFDLFLSNIEKVAEELKVIKSLGSSMEEENKRQYSNVEQHVNDFKYALEKYVAGTVPQRNKAFFESIMNKNG